MSGKISNVPCPPLEPLPHTGLMWVSECGLWVYVGCTKYTRNKDGNYYTTYWKLIKCPFLNKGE